MFARIIRSSCSILAFVGACGPSSGAPENDATGDTSTSSPSQDSGTADATAQPESGPPTDTSDASDSSPATTSTTSDGTDESGAVDTTGEPQRPDGPTHLLVIRTPHGVFPEHVWTGSGEAFTLGPVLEPLAPWSDALVLVDGLENVITVPDGAPITNAYGVTSSSLWTGGLLGSSVGDAPYVFYFGGGPSLDVVLGDILGVATPLASVHLGVQASDGGAPTGVSYTGADTPRPPIDSPALAFEAMFSGLPADPVLDALADALAAPGEGPGHDLELQLHIAYAAIALDITRVQLLSIDRGLPAIRWTELGVNTDYHEVVASAQPDQVEIVQTFWAQQIALLLTRLDETPVGTGSLLDRTLVVWSSAEGSPPAAYSTDDVFAVVIDASGTFDTGRVVELEDADQADFAVTIAAAMGAPLPEFGHPDLDAMVIADLLAP